MCQPACSAHKDESLSRFLLLTDKSNNLILGFVAVAYRNPILVIIIHRDEMFKPKLDYLDRFLFDPSYMARRTG
jgi:hypothetical protein